MKHLLALALALLASAASAQTFQVAPNGTYPDRPAYNLVMPTGPQVGPQSGRVKVGEACDCAEPIKKGSATYCPIAATPNKVAVCKAVPPPDPVMHSGLNANLEGALAGDPGTSEFRVRATTEQPAPSSDGAFRTVCKFVGFKYDDPIVHPGMPGTSHLHTPVGNASFNANSTIESLKQGNSACRGGTANRSSYWVTSLLDMRTMKPVMFEDWLTYYKASSFDQATGYGWRDAAGVWHPALKPWPGFTAPPNGLKIVAGDPTAMTLPPNNPLRTRWQCQGGGLPNAYSQTIPDCPVGQALTQEVFFPQCWDGINLDSPDHKSHMSYTVQVKNAGDPRPSGTHRECPDTHPVVLPQISFSIRWPAVTEAGQTKNYRLSADSDLTLPAGLRNHGDVIVLWDETVKDLWMKNCIRANADCHAHLLGDGKTIY